MQNLSILPGLSGDVYIRSLSSVCRFFVISPLGKQLCAKFIASVKPARICRISVSYNCSGKAAKAGIRDCICSVNLLAITIVCFLLCLDQAEDTANVPSVMIIIAAAAEAALSLKSGL